MPPPPALPPPAATPANDRTNLYGWLGIVIGLCCCPIVGIVLGFLALQEAKKAGKPPTLAYIAIALSIVSAITGAVLSLTGTLRWPGTDK
jgi:hypothetical protein